ncbi:NmrA family NAD(P)-binding protein [Halorubrum sp. SD612]|uniref:NmrA family NAD(P)-binding protein n=1 Tax=Halorubrum sp. SD612 TaxID=1855863 RepID=UPI000A2ED27B|nr:NmrA family NAD(P)-binding protein [Halorubrum sp. SD612]OTF06593.1 NAD(P)-dependent oxidoreductase [Halorubrum sp. SD612]
MKRGLTDGDGSGRPTADRVLVTGATGTVGEPLVRELSDGDASVRLATRSPDDARERFGEGPEYVEFDLAHPETWGATLADVDRLFLLYPPGSAVSDVTEFADAADRVGVEHVAFLSILGAEKFPVLPHRRIETHIAGTDLAHTFLRASWFAQNLSEIHRREIVERDEIFVPAGDGVLSFTDARDVAAVAATVLTEPGHRDRAYDLTGPAALDFEEVAEIFSEVLDRPIEYADPSRLTFARQMYRRRFSPGFVAFMVAEYSVVRLGRSGRTTDDVEALLGRPPRTVREFVEDYTDEFRA